MNQTNAKPQNAPVDATEEDVLDQEDSGKFLLFRLGQETYGTPLLGVREVLQPLTPKPVPNTVKHFLGLINIRGQIIGVVDLRIRFGYPTETPSTLAYLVFETDMGPIAAIVDRVEAVTRFDESQLQSKPNIRTQVPVDFLLGATNHLGQLVTLIDLNKTLSHEDYVAIEQAKTAGGN